MGFLRFLLAVAVILAHTAPLPFFGFVDGTIAVEAFFIISGFYIALILNEKYINENSSYWLFISNRLLRLLPLYWIILILTFGISLLFPVVTHHPFLGSMTAYKQYGHNLSFITWVYLAFTNVFVLFQDTVLFFGLNLTTGNIFYTPNFHLNNPGLYRFELVPQAWSINLELMFYLIAPFIIRRKWWVIMLVLLVSMAFKFYGSQHGLGNDPWSYRFFPFELMYFLLGAVAYIAYKKFIQKINIPVYVNIFLIVFLIGFTVFYTKIHAAYVYPVYIACVFAFVPLIYKYTKDFKFDRFIGELSYPIYISHFLVLNTLSSVGLVFHLNVLTIAGSVGFSLILVKFISVKIERVRQARVSSGNGINKNAYALSVKL